jgi:hypothetical protein
MAAVMHHTIHVPESMRASARWLDKFFEAVLFTLLPPVAFAMLIVSGLLLALAVSKLL